jgi:hypothetical protein
MQATLTCRPHGGVCFKILKCNAIHTYELLIVEKSGSNFHVNSDNFHHGMRHQVADGGNCLYMWKGAKDGAVSLIVGGTPTGGWTSEYKIHTI